MEEQTIASAPPLEVPSSPPQADISDTVFNFHNGELGKVKRIVQRQQLKTRIKFLEQVIRLHQPLVNAMRITQKAFQDGVKEGLLQAIKADQEQAAKVQKMSAGQEIKPTVRPEEQAPLVAKVNVDLPDASPALTPALKALLAMKALLQP